MRVAKITRQVNFVQIESCIKRWGGARRLRTIFEKNILNIIISTKLDNIIFKLVDNIIFKYI